MKYETIHYANGWKLVKAYTKCRKLLKETYYRNDEITKVIWYFNTIYRKTIITYLLPDQQKIEKYAKVYDAVLLISTEWNILEEPYIDDKTFPHRTAKKKWRIWNPCLKYFDGTTKYSMDGYELIDERKLLKYKTLIYKLWLTQQKIYTCPIGDKNVVSLIASFTTVDVRHVISPEKETKEIHVWVGKIVCIICALILIPLLILH